MSFINQNALNTDTSNEASEANTANASDTPSEKSKSESANDSTTKSNYDGKRYKDLQSYHNKTLNGKNQELEALKKKIKELESGETTLNKEKLVSFMKKQPELYDVISQVVKEGQVKVSSELRDELDKVERLTMELAAKNGFKELLEYHPDAQEIRNDPEFLSWVEVQSNKIRNILTDNDSTVDEIAFAIDKYKKDKGIKSKKKQSQKEGAESVTSPNKPDAPREDKDWSESEIMKLSPEEFLKNKTSIEKAMKSNNIILDVSQGRGRR
jgi:hypothetical protein